MLTWRLRGTRVPPPPAASGRKIAKICPFCAGQDWSRRVDRVRRRRGPNTCTGPAAPRSNTAAVDQATLGRRQHPNWAGSFNAQRKGPGNRYAAVNASNDIGGRLRRRADKYMITSNNSPTCDCHKPVNGHARSTLLEGGHRFAGKDCIASWNPSNPWRDTDE
jgi:hypothetical protein